MRNGAVVPMCLFILNGIIKHICAFGTTHIHNIVGT